MRHTLASRDFSMRGCIKSGFLGLIGRYVEDGLGLSHSWQ